MKMRLNKFIRTLTLCISVLACCALTSKAGLILTEGQVFEFEFQDITLINSGPIELFGVPAGSSNIYAFAEFSLGNNLLNIDESLIFSVFENSTDEQPIRSDIIHGSGTSGVGYLTNLVSSVPWVDKQGIFRIEMLTGSVELNSLTAATFPLEGGHCEQTYAIPEPNSVALLFLGTGIIYLRRKRFSNQRVEPTRYNAR
jgi:hypothetical protein